MKLPVKKIWIILGAILLLLIVLNPGIARFKEYSGLSNKDSHSIRRTCNFILFSIYENTNNNERFLGVLMNFINITPQKASIKHSDKPTNLIDSALKPASDFNELPIPAFRTIEGKTYTKHLLKYYNYSDEDIRKAIYNGRLTPIDLKDMVDDPKLTLWSALSEINLYDKSFEEFNKKYSSLDSVNYLFNGMSIDNIYKKSRDEFYEEYFPEFSKSPAIMKKQK